MAASGQADGVFRDRADAGRRLAEDLGGYAGRSDAVVLGLPRGGVPVAYEVARALGAPLDVFVVRKLGVPGHEELAMGAIASGGVRVMNEEILRELDLSEDAISATAAEQQREVERREVALRDGGGSEPLGGRTAILVDDGLATGATMRAAALAARAQEAAEIVVAVPVGAPATCSALRADADAVVCAREPEPFHAVGAWYADFAQTTEDEVRELIARARRERQSGSG